MKKYLLLLALLYTAHAAVKAQSYDPKQISAMTQAYMNAGDTVGIYAYNTDKPHLMESIKYKGIKANALGYALTGGLAKTKVKLQFAGTTSPYVFTGNAHFRIYFGNVPASKMQRLYMFQSSNSIRDLAIAKFDIKKDERMLIQSSFSLFGGSQSGTETNQDVKINYTEVRDGVYDATVTAQPGEYCFVFTNNGAGGMYSVFDFTIK